MTRRRWDDATRRRTIAIARAHGAAEAARRTGVSSSTVRSWVARGVEPHAGGEVGNDASVTPAGAFTVSELEALQRKAGVALDAALDSGRTIDAQRLSVVNGVLLDKVRQAKPVQTEAGAGVASATAALTRIKGMRTQFTARRLRALSNADLHRLRAEAAVLHGQIVQFGLRRRVLIEEMDRRRRGVRSAFAGVTEDEASWPAAWRSGS